MKDDEFKRSNAFNAGMEHGTSPERSEFLLEERLSGHPEQETASDIG
jgi:hypothetical protein